MQASPTATFAEHATVRHIPLRSCTIALRVFLAFAGLACAGAVAPAVAQDSAANEVHIVPRSRPVIASGKPSPALSPSERIVKDVDLVLLPVTVTDEANRPVIGLNKSQVQILEAGKPQEVRHFYSEEAPISLAVILDMSSSMGDKFQDSCAALSTFFETTNPEDEFVVITFADKPEVLSDFTRDVQSIQSQLVYRAPKGSTALLDAIYVAISKLNQAHHERRALLVISDGGDNHSRYTLPELKKMLQESDVQIYSIGMHNYILGTSEEWTGPALLQDLAEMSGGRAFRAAGSSEFKSLTSTISNLLRHQYVLAYKPTNVPRDGKWHKIKVKLLLPKGVPHLLVSAKRGYYAPRQK